MGGGIKSSYSRICLRAFDRLKEEETEAVTHCFGSKESGFELLIRLGSKPKGLAGVFLRENLNCMDKNMQSSLERINPKSAHVAWEQSQASLPET